MGVGAGVGRGVPGAGSPWFRGRLHPALAAPRESADPPGRPAGRAGRRASPAHAADSAGGGAVQPRAIRPRAPLRPGIVPAATPERCAERGHCLARPGRAAPRPSARAWGGRNALFPLPSLFGPGTASPSPWLPLT